MCIRILEEIYSSLHGSSKLSDHLERLLPGHEPIPGKKSIIDRFSNVQMRFLLQVGGSYVKISFPFP